MSALAAPDTRVADAMKVLAAEGMARLARLEAYGDIWCNNCPDVAYDVITTNRGTRALCKREWLDLNYKMNAPQWKAGPR